MASSNGDCVMIQFLLDGGASLLEARTKADATPLHEAALQNHPRALALLATRAPSLVDVHNKVCFRLQMSAVVYVDCVNARDNL